MPEASPRPGSAPGGTPLHGALLLACFDMDEAYVDFTGKSPSPALPIFRENGEGAPPKIPDAVLAQRVGAGAGRAGQLTTSLPTKRGLRKRGFFGYARLINIVIWDT